MSEPKASQEPDVVDLATRPVLVVSSPDGTPSTTSIHLDGQDITRQVRDVAMHLKAGELHRAEIELNWPRLDVVTRAVVTFLVKPPKGYVVIEEPQPDGGKRWRTEREVK